MIWLCRVAEEEYQRKLFHKKKLAQVDITPPDALLDPSSLQEGYLYKMGSWKKNWKCRFTYFAFLYSRLL